MAFCQQPGESDPGRSSFPFPETFPTKWRLCQRNSLPFCCWFLDVYLFWEREREREREREFQVGSTLSHTGLKPTNHEIMTWGKIKSRMLNPLSHPGAPIHSFDIAHSYDVRATKIEWASTMYTSCHCVQVHLQRVMEPMVTSLPSSLQDQASGEHVSLGWKRRENSCGKGEPCYSSQHLCVWRTFWKVYQASMLHLILP